MPLTLAGHQFVFCIVFPHCLSVFHTLPSLHFFLLHLSHFYFFLSFIPCFSLISIPLRYSPPSVLIPFLAPSTIPAYITTHPHPYFQFSYLSCYFQAFASQCLFCMRHLGIPIEKVNPYGGAIALGHPLGCSGKSQ